MKAGECGCCDAFITEGYPFHDREYFKIVRTNNDKGHSQRFMVVSYTHAPHVADEEYARSELMRFMILAHQDFTIMEPTHASIPGHWHIVACSLDEGTDQNKI